MAKAVVVKAVIVIEVVPNEKNNHYSHNKTKENQNSGANGTAQRDDDIAVLGFIAKGFLYLIDQVIEQFVCCVCVFVSEVVECEHTYVLIVCSGWQKV